VLTSSKSGEGETSSSKEKGDTAKKEKSKSDDK